jgi:choline dehydrogenase-like flavoprotein
VRNRYSQGMRDSSNTKAPFDKTNESVDFGRDTRTADFAEKVRVNQQMLSAKSKSNYDFIICGSGPSGLVVARRVAENPDVSLLLLQAGGSDDVPAVMDAGHRTLKVYGVESLRIADGSIMPRVTTVKTTAPYVVIGERDADILRTEHRLSMDAEVNT